MFTWLKGAFFRWLASGVADHMTLAMFTKDGRVISTSPGCPEDLPKTPAQEAYERRFHREMEPPPAGFTMPDPHKVEAAVSDQSTWIAKRAAEKAEKEKLAVTEKDGVELKDEYPGSYKDPTEPDYPSTRERLGTIVFESRRPFLDWSEVRRISDISLRLFLLELHMYRPDALLSDVTYAPRHEPTSVGVRYAVQVIFPNLGQLRAYSYLTSSGMKLIYEIDGTFRSIEDCLLPQAIESIHEELK